MMTSGKPQDMKSGVKQALWGVIVLEADDRCVFLNEVARDMLQVSDSYLGRPACDVFTQPSLLSLIEEKDSNRQVEAELVLSEECICRAAVVAVDNLGFVVSLFDVTEYHRKGKSKHEFINTVTHDLRTPLTAILGYVKLVERAGEVNDLQRSFIGRVESSILNMNKLLTDLMSLEKVESCDVCKKTQVDLQMIFNQCLQEYREQIEKNELQIVQQIDGVCFLAREEQIRLMITHLFENAVKFSKSGGKVEVHAEINAGLVTIYVQDEGIGIPLQDSPHIFDKLYRGSNIGEDIRGNGMGLAIVKAAVENHGGKVRLDSSKLENEGALFVIELPVELI